MTAPGTPTFGFTHCRMVCPRALARLTAALALLGPLAEQLADRLRPLLAASRAA